VVARHDHARGAVTPDCGSCGASKAAAVINGSIALNPTPPRAVVSHR
jgi:hypothetical protein